MFVSRPEYGYLSGTGFTDFVQGFAHVSAYATAGGVNRPICTIRRGTTRL